MRPHFQTGCRRGAAVLELGVGDSIASGLVARAAGAGKVYLIDVARFAKEDARFYKKLARDLANRGLDVPDISKATTINEVLKLCNAEYQTDGLASLCSLPDQSVDMVWSQAVLEHIRKAQFEATMAELRRIMRPGARASHVVDFKDHLTGALNNLRFSEALWESSLFANSGFYTNRIQAPAMLAVFERCGFGQLDVRKEWRWNKLPTRRSAFDPMFRKIPEADLLINCMKVTMQIPDTGVQVANADGINAWASP